METKRQQPHYNTTAPKGLRGLGVDVVRAIDFAWLRLT